jgi:hypothetical protein
MLAYHSNPTIKADILAQLERHRRADALVQGYGYWEDGKGCAVGCTLHSGNHMEYESRFGIPVMIARLEDCIFEGLPAEQARQWPERLMSAIEPGSDLSRVGWKFLHWLFTDEGVNPGITHPVVSGAIKQCADVLVPLTKGERVDESAAWSASWSAAASAAWSAAASAAERAAWSAAASAAERAAWSAAWSAASAAERAAWSAAASAAERAAWSAAWSAASAAESAARGAESAAASAASAAESAAWSAASAAERAARGAESAAESAARSAARSAAYIQMSDKLIELIIADRPKTSEAADE